jgi:hypothetical protein
LPPSALLATLMRPSFARAWGVADNKMARFEVGVYVERVGALVPSYMKSGRVVRVIPHPDLPEGFTEYEIDFKFVVATFYENQLKLAEYSPPR